MLVLLRRVGESILIGDNIKLTILPGSRPNRVNIGIIAPKSVGVFREELINNPKRGKLDAKRKPADNPIQQTEPEGPDPDLQV